MRRLLLVGLLLFTPLLFAQTWKSTVKSTKFVSTVVVSNGIRSEQVTLNGEMAALIMAPASCTPQSVSEPCHLVPIRVLYSAAAIGIGQTSGRTYFALGTNFIQGTFDMPGAFVWNVDLFFIFPSPILPWKPVTLQGVANVNSEGVATAVWLPPAGLVSWWQGEGNGVDVMGRNPATLNGTVNFAPGRFQQAFDFIGQGFFQAGPSATLQTPTLTAMAWVRNLGLPGHFNYVLSQGAQACDAPSYGFTTGAAGNLFFGIFDGGSTGASFVTSPDAGPKVWDGNWHLVAGTYDGQLVRMFVDGVEVAPGTPSTITIDYALPTSQQFRIGTYEGGGCSLTFSGDVDEVRIFNRALSAAEIQAVYKSTP